MATQKTTVGTIEKEVLAYTAGADIHLDVSLARVDCVGTAAHVMMLSRMPVKPKLFSVAERKKITEELVRIIRLADKGLFSIKLADQDVHLAVERRLTNKLGSLGKKVHTARSRNDQVALDLRLFGKEQLLMALTECAQLAAALLSFARKHKDVPMVGRTHMQPAMPSSVGLWAASLAEGLLDDISGLIHAFEINDQCPLGAAAGYGVPMPIDRTLVSDLLGFSRPCHTSLHATNARGKNEAVTLGALAHVMVTASRLAQDLVLYTMPEFNYFTMPAAFCTGSSIMPQKSNPDVLELVRAKAAKVAMLEAGALEILRASPTGYNRDIQETKAPLVEGFDTTRATLRILCALVPKLKVNKKALLAGFTPEVFATDAALQKVAEGMPFRDAYQYVKEHLSELEEMDPHEAIARKNHLGGPAGIDFDLLENRAREAVRFANDERKQHERALTKLLGYSYRL